MPKPTIGSPNWGQALNEHLDGIAVDIAAKADASALAAKADVSALAGKQDSATLPAIVAAEVANPASPVAATLAAPSGPVVARSSKTTFYDSFAGKPDHTIVAGETSDSGHPYTVRNTGGSAFQVIGGYLTITQGATGSTKAGYLGPDLTARGASSTDRLSRIGCTFRIPASANPPAALTLIASLLQFTAASDATGYSVAGCHTNLNLHASAPPNIQYQTLDAGSPFTNNTLGRAYFPGGAELARDVDHTVEIVFKDTQAAVILTPDGQEPIRFNAPLEPKVKSQNGPWPTWELTALSGATREIPLISAIWAELESRSEKSAPVASLADTAVATIQPGRTRAFIGTTGASAATGITTSVSAALYSKTVTVPRSQRALVRGLIWIDCIVPATPVATSLIIYADPSNSTYRKAQTVRSGTTPYNTGAAYTMGQHFPFEIELDLSAYEIGSEFLLQIKASAGATGQFTFIDSGSASGGASSLRSSTLQFIELPAA